MEIALLTRVYPDRKWDKDRLENSNKRAMQKILKDTLSKIFVDHGELRERERGEISNDTPEVLEEYQHPDIFINDTMEYSPLDVFIPSLKLAFEYPHTNTFCTTYYYFKYCIDKLRYQGGQHYSDTPSFLFASTTIRNLHDIQKRAACEKAGVYLIEVCYIIY